MDVRRFDRMARLLGSATTRRAGLGAAVAAAFGAAAWSGNARGRGETEPEGPCGDGSRADNICSADKQCCTNHCDRLSGRCRCLQRGERCKANQTCCGGHSCIDNHCTSVRPPAPPTSTAAPTATPTGTLTPSPTPTNTPVPEPCTVCASGCQFSSVNAAIKATPAGGTITVAPGTWETFADVYHDITIRGCVAQGGSTSNVVLKEPTPAAGVVLGINRGATMTVSNLTLSAAKPGVTKDGFIVSSATLVLDAVKVDGFNIGLQSRGGTIRATSTLFTGGMTAVQLTGATFIGNRTDFYGDGTKSAMAFQFFPGTQSYATITQGIVTGYTKSAFMLTDSSTPLNLTLDGVVVRNNTGGNQGAGAAINAGSGANILLKGATAFRNNRATGAKADGGAIRLKIDGTGSAQKSSLKIEGGSVEFTNNKAIRDGSASCPTCAGAIEVECNQKSQVAFSRVQSASYSGNTPVTCALLERASGNTQKEVRNCNFG
ncbi:MAG: dickkopf-related protein [Chloroflexota bacterium]